MRAMVLTKAGSPLQLENPAIPEPQSHEVLIKIEACAVCRTDLHIWDGELHSPHLPLILGHQVVGEIVTLGKGANRFAVGDRVGAPWLAKSCEHCVYCQEGKENLCDSAVYRGYQMNGGFAEYCVADENYIFAIPKNYSSTEAAPLLCGGLIGYRAWQMLENAKTIGFYGFGSSAHILTQMATHQGQEVYAFTRPGDSSGQAFARQVGAVWAGGSDELPPVPLDGAIIFAPVGSLVPVALQAVKKAGVVVCAGIHMSAIPSFSYDLLYGERILRSVTNLTRQDGEEFFKLAREFKIKTHVTTYPLEEATQAMQDIKNGKIVGSAVLVIS